MNKILIHFITDKDHSICTRIFGDHEPLPRVDDEVVLGTKRIVTKILFVYSIEKLKEIIITTTEKLGR